MRRVRNINTLFSYLVRHLLPLHILRFLLGVPPVISILLARFCETTPHKEKGTVAVIWSGSSKTAVLDPQGRNKRDTKPTR